VQVDDPTAVPPEVRDLIREMDRELRDIARDSHKKDARLAEAEARINAVLDQFRIVGAGLYEQRQEAGDPAAPGSADADATPTPAPVAIPGP
jgi:hypothetical protein